MTSVTLVEALPNEKDRDVWCFYCDRFAARGTRHYHFSTLEGFLELVDKQRAQASELKNGAI